MKKLRPLNLVCLRGLVVRKVCIEDDHVQFYVDVDKRWYDKTTHETGERCDRFNVFGYGQVREACVNAKIEEGEAVFLRGQIRSTELNNEPGSKPVYSIIIAAEYIRFLDEKPEPHDHDESIDWNEDKEPGTEDTPPDV